MRAPRRTSPTRLLRALVAVGLVVLVLPAIALAATVGQVAAFAETTFSMSCQALEATTFGLMPLRFMPGHTVYKWNRLGWALLFGLSIFGFVHILIGPSSGYVSDLSPQAFIAALGVFAAFGALSILTWGYFRFRPTPAERSGRRDAATLL